MVCTKGMDRRRGRGQVMVVRVMVGMSMPVRVAMRIGVCMSRSMRVPVCMRCLTSGITPEKQRTAYPGNDQARKETQPRVEALRDHIA
jgi:hypothetical protein